MAAGYRFAEAYLDNVKQLALKGKEHTIGIGCVYALVERKNQKGIRFDMFIESVITLNGKARNQTIFLQPEHQRMR